MQTPVRQAFFSYSRADSKFVLQLASDLREKGATVWLDQLDIQPGQRWDSAIEQSLGACRCLLVVLSPSSVDSTNVMDEVSFALEEHKEVIPVLYLDCKIPFRLRRLQYMDFRSSYDEALRQLLKVLAELPTAAPPPAAEAVGHAALAAGAAGVPLGQTHAPASEPAYLAPKQAPEPSSAPTGAKPESAGHIGAVRRPAPEAVRAADENPQPAMSDAKPSRTKYWIAGVVVAAALGIWGMMSPGKSPSPTDPKKGTAAPVTQSAAPVTQPAASVTQPAPSNGQARAVNLGRTIDFSDISINGAGDHATVAPGTDFTLAFHWKVTGKVADSDCPGCITQFYVGVPNQFAKCISPGIAPGVEGSEKISFKAPQEAGAYRILSGATWKYACTENNVDYGCAGRPDGCQVAALRVGN